MTHLGFKFHPPVPPSWRFGVAVASFVAWMKLLYVGPG